MDSTTNKLVLAFITLLLGVFLLTSVSLEVQGKTFKARANDESIVIPALDVNQTNSTYIVYLTNYPGGWKEIDSGTNCWITSLRLKNQTGDTGYNLTITTDYLFNANNGTLRFVNGSHAVRRLQNASGAGANRTYGDYSYCPNDYINLSWGRTVLNAIPGFFAITLVLISAGLFYLIAKDWG